MPFFTQLAEIKKRYSKKIWKRPRNRIFDIILEIIEIFFHHENVRHFAKIQYFEL